MASLKAMLFDMDGTLIETETINARAYSLALKSYNVHVDVSQIEHLIHGKHWSQFLPAICQNKIDLQDYVKVAELKQVIYKELIHEARINEHLMDLINHCSIFLKIGLVTTASKAAVSLILPRLNLTRNFDCIVTGDDVKEKKPAPDAYILAATALGVTPKECLVFEDSKTGIESALSFGASVLQVHPFI